MGVGKLWPTGHLFLFKGFIGTQATHIHLCMVYSSFCGTMSDLRGNRDLMACKAKNIYYQALQRESLLTSGVYDILASIRANLKTVTILLPTQLTHMENG